MQTRISLAVLLAATILVSLGCKTTIIDTGTETSATYRLGKLTTEEAKDINSVYQAAEKTLAALEVNITQKLKDELAAKITARDSRDKKVTIELLAVGGDRTKITIAVRPVEKARRIYQMMRDNLQ